MHNFIHTNNSSDIRLVAAVGAMGILCESDSKGCSTMAITGKGGTTRTWLMSSVSNCGKWRLSDLLTWWRDRDFHQKNDSHPFNAVKCAMACKRALGIAMKQHKSVLAAPRGSSFVLEVMDSHREPAVPSPGCHVTDDLGKVAAFCAMGFECSEVKPNGTRRLFQIPPHAMGKTYEFMDLAWNDNLYHEKNPQMTFSYVKATLANYIYLVGEIKRNKPLVEITKGDSFAFLHPDCSAETERKIMTQFNQ